MNTVNEGAEVTLGGRLFHARAAITQNERSPIAKILQQLSDHNCRLPAVQAQQCVASFQLLTARVPYLVILLTVTPPSSVKNNKKPRNLSVLI